MKEVECLSCHTPLSAHDLAEGWCDHCGKKIPAYIVTEARRRDLDRQRPAFSPRREEPAGAEETAAGPPDARRTTVTLRGDDERVTQRLPGRCMCCGNRSTHSVEKKFIRFPLWTCVLAAFGVLPFYIALLLLRRSKVVSIPVCPRHRRPWLRQQLFAVFTLLYLLVLPWFVILLSARIGHLQGRGHPASIALLAGWFVGIPLLLVFALVIRRRTIHVRKITADGIILGGVSASFAGELR